MTLWWKGGKLGKNLAIVGGCGLLVGGVFYLGSLPSESSFTITHRVKAPSKVLFANDIDPETYWKYFPRANKEQSFSKITPCENGIDYDLMDNKGSITELSSKVKERWHKASNGDYVLDIKWEILSNVYLSSNWTYHAVSDKETDMTLIQTLKGPRLKVVFLTLSQEDALARIQNLAKSLEQKQ